MTVPISRMERLIRLLGGEENLPRKLASTDSAQQIWREGAEAADEAAAGSLQQQWPPALEVEPGDDWWNAMPQIPKPLKSVNPHRAKQAAVPVILESGEAIFPPDPHQGELAPFGLNFSPFLAITRLPYKFLKRQFLQPVASVFFDEGKIWQREWDIYCVYSNHYLTNKPTTFVPEQQLLALITEINEAFPDLNFRMTDRFREDGLVLSFNELSAYPSLRPRYLGRSTSRAQYDYWTDHASVTGITDNGISPDDKSLKAFKAKIDLANDLATNKAKTARDRKRAGVIAKRQDMVRSYLRAQRYLGVPPKTEESLLPDLSTLTINGIDQAVPQRTAFDQDVVFIAIDAEAYERPPRMITEIGFATLDTRDLHGKAPGEVGKEWHQYIRGRHICVAEHKHLVNSEFVHGCPDKFEFGKSEFVSENELPSTLASCFKQPFSGPGSTDNPEKRNIVLLGHALDEDIRYLQQAGYNVLNSGSLLETMDTADMYRSYTKNTDSRSLGGMLCDFNLTGWHLHNAGNDAVYTIWAMLAICVQSASKRGTEAEQQRSAHEIDKRTQAAVEQAG